MTMRVMEKGISMLVLAAVLIHGRDGRAERRIEPDRPALRHELDVSLAVSEMVPMANQYGTEDDAGLGPGLAISYGYFAKEWLRLEAQVQADAGLFLTDTAFLSGWALGGASICSARTSGLLLFAGLRLGFGYTLEGDSDGGLAKLRPALVIAPRAGLLMRLTARLGLHVYAEYQAAFVSTENKYEQGNRHMIRIPLGLSITF